MSECSQWLVEGGRGYLIPVHVHFSFGVPAAEFSSTALRRLLWGSLLQTHCSRFVTLLTCSAGVGTGIPLLSGWEGDYETGDGKGDSAGWSVGTGSSVHCAARGFSSIVGCKPLPPLLTGTGVREYECFWYAGRW